MIATTFIRAHLFTKQTLNLIIGIVFVVFLVFFIRHESVEIAHVKEILTSAKVSYIVLGIILSLLFILVQGNMYRLSFKSIDVKTSFSSCVILYLKRFSLGVFLPGGGVTNLLFYNKL